MPRPVFCYNKREQTQEVCSLGDVLQYQENSGQLSQIDSAMANHMLRKKRSKAYMNAIHSLDAGGHVHNQKKVNQIIQIVRNEFPEVHLSGTLLGYVAACYLGKPYEVHTLDMSGGIIEHYKVGELLPNGLEKARSLALQGRYEFVEVYVDCCRAIDSWGAVSVIVD